MENAIIILLIVFKHEEISELAWFPALQQSPSQLDSNQEKKKSIPTQSSNSLPKT